MSMSIGSFLYNGCLVTDIIHEKGGQCSFYCRFPLKSRFLLYFETKKQVVFDTTSEFMEVNVWNFSIAQLILCRLS